MLQKDKDLFLDFHSFLKLEMMKKQLFCPYSVLPLLFITLLLYADFGFGFSTISTGQSLSGNQTLISSPNGTFELGFFTPGKLGNYYIGIWYKSVPDRAVIWVANRENPISDTNSPVLVFLEDGNLVLLDRSRSVVWSTNSSSKNSNSTVVVELLDSGNLVIRDVVSDSIMWQSFDYPTDHWIPGSKVGYNKLKNTEQILRPWRSPENPAPGPWSNVLEPNGSGQLLLWNGSETYWSSGEWTGTVFVNVPEIQRNYYVRNITFVSNENETYMTYSSAVPSAFTRFVFDVTGQLRQYVWRKEFDGWALFWTSPGQQCEVYGFCGASGSCNQRSEPLCRCVEGFEPRMPEDWALLDHSSGCVRKWVPKCDGDSFSVIPNVRFPSHSESFSAVGSFAECRVSCLRNCSCTGFTYESNGCLQWKGDLYNLEVSVNDGGGKNFYLRVIRESNNKSTKKKIVVVAVAVVVSGLLLLVIVLSRMKRRTKGLWFSMEDSLMVFKYRDLRRATRNFSDKLGEGAFGLVYRGTLPDSTAVAAKKLKSLHQQGEKQFRTELKTIGEIQHVNLVRLRGFCVESSDRILVFDYMPNGSLNSVLFRNGESSTVLDWKARYNIAVGTAKGLAYLHEECRDCIIHCDIKPENVLLDGEFNPKVADFGLAKLLGREFSRVLTNFRGTRGYLAPEWLSGNPVTPKVDVFSYGMLLFEIISGRRNSDSVGDRLEEYFPIRAAKVLAAGQGDVGALLDQRLGGDADMDELSRAARVACWCIQDDELDRPTMRKVVQILEGVVEVETPPIPLLIQRLAEDSIPAGVSSSPITEKHQTV